MAQQDQSLNVVRAPRETDAIGNTLRAVFGCPVHDQEWTSLLRRLDRADPRSH